MCKILTLSDTSKMSVKELKTFLQVAFPIVTKSDDHGFGWACLGETGVFGERYVKPDSYSANMFNRIKMPEKMLKAVQVDSNSFGTISKPKGALLVHGRYSTNHINLKNTHPFVKNNWTLIHNGVVNNIGPAYKMQSSCDTEHLIEHLSNGDVTSMVKNVSGYYAITAIDPTGALHVIKDNVASLHCAFIKNIDSFIFATTRSIIEDVCLELKWKHSPIFAVNDNSHLIMVGNEIGFQSSISPVVETNKSMAASAAKAFGWTDKGREDGWDDYDSSTWERDTGVRTNNVADLFPEYEMDDKFEVWNKDGDRIMIDEFMALTDDEQNGCNVVEAGTGEFVELKKFLNVMSELRMVS